MQYNLNEEQLQAVNHKSGPLLIIAGAGTGKTAVITQRIVNIVDKKWATSDEILALTYTEKAAREMLERVDQSMPYGYAEMTIATFHSFCDKILRQESIYLGVNANYTLMTAAQSYVFFAKHIYDFDLKLLSSKNNPESNVAHILSHFSKLQDENVSPAEYLTYAENLKPTSPGDEEEKAIALELARAFKKYSDLKLSASKFDFADLITQTIKLFTEHPQVLDYYRAKYKYILVDEFQDTNYAQNVIINLLAIGQNPTVADKKKANITVVGDDDQAIYKFRGAAISNILGFKKLYPTAKKIVLTRNYRSKQRILDVAHTLVSNNNPYRLEITEGISKKLIASAPFEETPNNLDPVSIFEGKNGKQEAEYVAKEILQIAGKANDDTNSPLGQFDSKGQSSFVDQDTHSIKQYKFSDIAVLVRANSHSDEFIQAFRANGIPYRFNSPKGLYSRPEVQYMISFLRVMTNLSDDISFFNLLMMPVWELNPRELIEIANASKTLRCSMLNFLEDGWQVKLGSPEIDIETRKSKILDSNTTSFIKKILSQKSIASLSNLLQIFDYSMSMILTNSSVGDLLYNFVTHSGFLAGMTEDATAENEFKVQNMSKFFNIVSNFEKDNPGTNIFDFIKYLDYSIEIGEIPVIDTDITPEYDGVNILTVHSAKGLEFPVVFLVNLVDRRFPMQGKKENLPIPTELIKETIPDQKEIEENLQEERRLFYVGLTRAKERLYLTRALTYREGKQKWKKSRFIDESLPENIQDESIENEIMNSEIDFEATTDIEKTISFTPEIVKNVVEDELSIFDEIKYTANMFSYSQLNCYENCPKQYRYRYILRIPGKPSNALAFGSSVHNTLKDFYTEVKKSQQGFAGFSQMPSKDDLFRFFDGHWISQGYKNKEQEMRRKEEGKKCLSIYYDEVFSPEKKIMAIELPFKYKVGDIQINGKIDRIDIQESTSSSTSDSISNDLYILDYKTGNAPKNMKVEDNLQLAIYTLATESIYGKKVDKVALYYIEDKILLESIPNDNDKKKAIERISEITSKVQSGDFKPTPGFPCRYCDYRDICSNAEI